MIHRLKIETVRFLLKFSEEFIKMNDKHFFNDLVNLLLKDRETTYDDYVFVIEHEHTIIHDKISALNSIFHLKISSSKDGVEFLKKRLSNLKMSENQSDEIQHQIITCERLLRKVKKN